jgi:23S rRNA pseudouridine1911/1915/1917 synthase
VTGLVSDGRVAVDGQRVDVRSRTLGIGQTLRVDIAPPVADGPRADAGVEFAVVHEDSDLIVVDKPAGLVVHHGAGHRGGTLVDGLLARFPELADLASSGAGEPDRPGIVHRLDKGTSGLLVVARSPAAFHSLSGQLRSTAPVVTTWPSWPGRWRTTPGWSTPPSVAHPASPPGWR